MDSTLISVFPAKTAVSAMGVSVEVPYNHPARQILVVIQYWTYKHLRQYKTGVKINAVKC